MSCGCSSRCWNGWAAAPGVSFRSAAAQGAPLWTQMRADIAGLPLETPAVTEATAAGAALLAAWAPGSCPRARIRPR